MKQGELLSFRRIFKYIWPQWPRLVMLVLTALVIAVLFSLSFATIIPLLKVMMGEEGLHGWVDRKTCNVRYGVNFYVPDRTDFLDSTGIAYYLLVTNIEEESPAEHAGVQKNDHIIGVGSYSTDGQESQISSAKLLEVLSGVAKGSTVKVQLRRYDLKSGQPEYLEVNLSAPAEPASLVKGAQWAMVDVGQWMASFLPRGQDKENRLRTVVFIILLMAVVTTLRCIARFYQNYIAEKVTQVSITGLRQDAFAHVLVMPVGFFSTEGTSDTTSRIIGDTATVGKGIKILIGKTLREPLKAISMLVLAASISWQLTLIFLCCAPVTIGLFGLLGKKIKKATKRHLISIAIMLGKIQDVMHALRVVKVYNRQEHENQSYQEITKTYLRRVLRVARIEATANPLMEWLGMVAGSAALLVGAHWVFSPDKNLQSSSFFGLLVFLGTTAESIRKVSDVWNKIQSSNAAAERVYNIIDTPIEFEAPNAVELAPLKKELEFREIVFKYPGSEQPTLKGINLVVNSGQTVAVVGPNGSGKTTLINLIPRLYDPDSGHILIDGIDIQKATFKSLRHQIGLVTQNVVTFNNTIAANIGYGKDDAAMEEIIAAAKRSFAHEFIEPLPEGYHTMIGEHGSGFSGGQLQRIVIARAILKNPSILIFDEAMSQIDADSEAKIQKALAELMEGRTCFVIAHRFSTVINADSIVVMDGGTIAAQGTHEELIESCELYQSLYETQLVKAE